MTTTTDAGTAVPIPTARKRSGYGAGWARVPRELGFILPLLPITMLALGVLSAVFFTGVGTIVLVFGIFIVLAALYIARGFGMFELLRLSVSGFPAITAPRWDRAAPRAGRFGKVIAPLVDGHYWLHLLHGMIVNPIVGTITWSITVSWVGSGLGGVSYWFWQRFIPSHDVEWSMARVWADFFVPGNNWNFDFRVGDSIVYFFIGVVCLLTLPFVTRFSTWAHYGIARGMLGEWRSAALAEQVADLSASRSAAVAAEGTALRRLERDIHDGPQQRLVRLQMDLAAADRQLDQDPEAARALLSEALTQSQEALDELRALSRGFAPPILLDRGLVAALESLADRSPIPTRVVAELPADLVLPAEWERNSYFIAAEALTNAVKHSGATTIEVRVAVVPDAVGSRLDITVTDDGQGGATPTPGHGIAGLDERLRGLGGTLDLSSPAGGPTIVAAHLPLPA